jgi:hypothetical protein
MARLEALERRVTALQPLTAAGQTAGTALGDVAGEATA